MLKRKVEDALKAWKEEAGHKPIIIKGCRQCGKTFSVRKFAKENYANMVYLNFIENPDYMMAFEGSKKIDDITMNITAMMPETIFESGKTCLVLDEIQDCPAARSALKFFQIDGRYDVIATGSLLGVRGYGEKSGYSSIPVGYETHLNMFPLDFEEFLWACGITRDIINRVKECLEKEQPVPEALHQRFRQLLLQYTVVGGMPDIVSSFIESHDMGKVLAGQRSIVDSYEEDMVKYAPDRDKSRIRECFESIPRQLGKENKKFQYSLIQKGAKASQYAGSIQWIEDAGIVCRCRNLNITELPLDGNAMEDVFKIYMVDTGLFVSMLEDGTQFDILLGKLHGYKGAIFENLIADIFAKMGRKLYYFRKDSGLEIDFVMRYQEECTLVEVKAQTGNVKSSKTILSHPEKYHVNRLVKLGDYNVGRQDKMLVLPLYMAFLLRQL